MERNRSGCVTWLGVALVVVVGFTCWAVYPSVVEFGQVTFRALGAAVQALLQILVWGTAGFVVTVIGLLILRKVDRVMDSRNDRRRQRDGAFALVEQSVRLGDGTRARLVVDPNRLVGPAALLTADGQALDLAHPALLEQYAAINAQRAGVARVQAMAPGDRAVEQLPGYRLPASAWRVADRPRLEAHDLDAAELPPADAPPPLSPVEALRESTPTAWVLGQADDGDLYRLDWLATAHALVLGTTGQGKSQSSLTHMMMLGARHGRAIVLDGKGGGEYDGLQPWIDYRRAEPATVLEYLRTLEEIAHERRATLRRAHVDEWRKLGPDADPRLWLFFDELGGCRQRMDAAAQREFDGAMLVALSQWRVYGMHWIVAEQRPDLITKAYRALFAEVLVYKLGGGQGAAFQEHAAHELKRGQFLANGVKYNAWLMAPEAPRLMQRVPPPAQKLLPPPPALDGDDGEVEGEWRDTADPNSAPNSAPNYAEPVRPPNSAPNSAVRRATSGTEQPNRTEPAEQGRVETPATHPPVVLPFDVRDAPKRRIAFAWQDAMVARHGRHGTHSEFVDWLAANGLHVGYGHISDLFKQWREERAQHRR